MRHASGTRSVEPVPPRNFITNNGPAMCGPANHIYLLGDGPGLLQAIDLAGDEMLAVAGVQVYK